MNPEDKLNITISLAGLPKIPLAVARNDEEIMRRAESHVNELWNRWITGNFASETQLKVMARVAFQFAVLYLRGERDLQNLQNLDSKLTEIINKTNNSQQPQ